MVAFDVEKSPQYEHTTPMPLGRVPYVEPPPRKPRPCLAKMYDSFRSQDALFFIEDFEFHGVFTPTAGSTISVPLILNQSPNYLLYRFPKATSLYIGVNTFSISNQTVPAVIGSLECIYVDPTGYPIHMGEYQSNNGNTRQPIKLFSKNPITDTDNPSFGAFTVSLNPGGGSAVTYNYSLSFSIGYLLPSEGYEEHEEHRCMICDHENHHQKPYESA